MTQSQLITSDRLKVQISENSVTVLDCRFDLANPDSGQAEYLAGHIPGAVYVHLDQDLAGPVTAESGRHPLPDPEEFAAKLGAKGVASDKKVVVYDASGGGFAVRAWWLLRWIGHTNAQLLDGGYKAWCKAGGESVAGVCQASPNALVPRVRNELVVTTEELLAAGPAIASMNLLDARDAARFRGEQEPIDRVAGHIPGARNLPLTVSLTEDGTFKTEAELKSIWNSALGDDFRAPWMVMCGSGVTACHLALSGVQAGRAEPRVYVGSWSEWIRDSERPVAKGD